MSTVRTRFAPSPTGYLHVGGVRTALFCWLYAKKTGGEFVLRVEDTDRERSTQESVDAILDGMAWLGLDADVGPVYQTERLDRYREVTDKLIADGHAYHCYCTKEELEAEREARTAAGEAPRYSRRCRDGREPVPGVDPIVRFKTPLDGEVTFADAVRGEITVANAELDDLVIMRGDGMPTYNFAVVVDDTDMQITHVIRGDDHINNTPRQINIFNALDYPLPTFAHVPMILGDDGARLSKRHGAVSVLEYRDNGYLPEALLNYLVRLGWSHGDQELFSRDEMVEFFDLTDVNKAASTFNTEKLDWLNQQYLKEADRSRLGLLYAAEAKRAGFDIAEGPAPEDVADAWRERASTIVDMVASTQFLYSDEVTLDEKAASKHLKPEAADVLAAFGESLAGLDDWQAPAIKGVMDSTVESLGIKFGKLGAPARLSVAGGMKGADLDVTIQLLGKDRTLARLESAAARARA